MQKESRSFCYIYILVGQLNHLMFVKGNNFKVFLMLKYYSGLVVCRFEAGYANSLMYTIPA